MTRINVSKWGNSLAIRLPKHIVEGLDLGNGSKIDVEVERGRLIAEPVRKRPRLSDLVKRITPENRHAATDFGKPRGKEVW